MKLEATETASTSTSNSNISFKTSEEYRKEEALLLRRLKNLKTELKVEKDKGKKHAIKTEIKSVRKEIKTNHFKAHFLVSDDIKYSGPLSYRWLRVIAWIALAAAQVLVINKMYVSIFSEPFLNGFGNTIFSLFSDITTPLFLIATIATILSRNKSFKSVLLLYLGGALGLGLAFLLFFNRYIAGVVHVFDKTIDIGHFFADLLGTKVQFNIFVDLFLMTLFDFFISYTPKKFFRGKKIYIFRLFSILPLLIVCGSFVFKILISNGTINPPIQVYAFLTTKAPFVYLIFISLSLLMKNREKLFLKFGGTKQQWNIYSKTNRTSLRFSISISIILAIVSFLDFILVLVVSLLYSPSNIQAGMEFALRIGFGQCVGLFLAIPFIMLFSYTKSYKNTAIDVILPFIGIGLIALVQLEGSFQILMKLQK